MAIRKNMAERERGGEGEVVRKGWMEGEREQGNRLEREQRVERERVSEPSGEKRAEQAVDLYAVECWDSYNVLMDRCVFSHAAKTTFSRTSWTSL